MNHRTTLHRTLGAAAIAATSIFWSIGGTDTVVHALETTLTIAGPAEPEVGLQRAARLDSPAGSDRQASVAQPAPDVQRILDLTNEFRATHGVAPLALHPQLTQAAQIHAVDHESRECVTGLSHTGTDGSNPGDRIGRTGLRVRNWGENIACGHTTAEAVMRGWIESPGHLANILNPSFTHLGVATSFGRDGYHFWGQVFGTPS